jgi:lysophospholipase L1-like esterase
MTGERSIRYAALGDSITLGMGDPLPTGGWRGFAALLADGLGAPGQVEFRNFARSGAMTADVAGEQLAEAQLFRPDVATLLIGANDTLRGAFDLGAIGDHLHRVVSELSAAGTRVVTACLPEPGRMLRLPASLARPLGRRANAVNELIHELASRYPGAHTHLADDPLVTARAMWSIDRLHPSEAGHRRLAGLYHAALAGSGWPVGAPPSPVPTNRPPTRRSQAWWMATRGAQWVLRRSTDLLPQLTMLAAAEWRLARRGSAQQLETRMAAEIAAAVAAMRDHGRMPDIILSGAGEPTVSGVS